MKRTTEINVELTRKLLIRHPAEAFEKASCARHGETVTPEELAVLADASTCVISRRIEADHRPSLESGDTCVAIEIESVEGQLILAAAMHSLERRLSAQDRTLLSVPPEPTAGQNTLAPNHPNLNGRNGFYLKLQSFYQFICPRALRFDRKEK